MSVEAIMEVRSRTSVPAGEQLPPGAEQTPMRWRRIPVHPRRSAAVRTTPFESPQSNGMAEAFVRTFKRGYVRAANCPDAETVLRSLPVWFTHYNEIHPHRALRYRSPRQFIHANLTP